MSKTTSYPSPRRAGSTEINGHKLYWECHSEAAGANVVLMHYGLGSIPSWKRQLSASIKSRMIQHPEENQGQSNPLKEAGSEREDV